MPLRNTSPDFDPRERFVLYRLCDCTTCEGRGKVLTEVRRTVLKRDPELYGGMSGVPGMTSEKHERCPDCRGEGRIRQEVATCETPEAVGVALVTLGREGEWDECPFGLLERGAGKDGAGHWIILPWLPSPRNVTDAARTLAKSKKRAPTS
jgi:hypothetical protein